MSNSRLNHQQVRTARKHGLSVKLIAERLGCSERQIRRICEDVTLSATYECSWLGTEFEYVVWMGYRNNGHSYRQIGHIFCLSHEHIRQTLNSKLEKDAA